MRFILFDREQGVLQNNVFNLFYTNILFIPFRSLKKSVMSMKKKMFLKPSVIFFKINLGAKATETA